MHVNDSMWDGHIKIVFNLFSEIGNKSVNMEKEFDIRGQIYEIIIWKT